MVPAMACSSAKGSRSQPAPLQPIRMAFRVARDFISYAIERDLRSPSPITEGIAAVHEQPGNVVCSRAAVALRFMTSEARIAPGVQVCERDRVHPAAGGGVETLSAGSRTAHLGID